MSLCQPEGSDFSCGSCCGLFNLKLDPSQLRRILTERTEEFSKSVDYAITHTIPAYRQSREKQEKDLPKKDDTTYNCPFLGYLDNTDSKIGCLIHPIRTKDPKSQNFSFYGSSICLGYECKNMENPNSKFWEEIFAEISKNSMEYSQFSANHIFVRQLEEKFGSKNFEIHRTEILELCVEWIKSNGMSYHLTSFEVDYGG